MATSESSSASSSTPTPTGESRRLGEGLTRIAKRWIYWGCALALLVCSTLFVLTQSPHRELTSELAGLDRWLYPQTLHHWLAKPDFAGLDIRAVHAVSAHHLVVVGAGGLIAHSRDGGRCWQLSEVQADVLPRTSAPSAHSQQACQDLSTLGRLRARVQSEAATVVETRFRTRALDLRSVHFADIQNGWLVGEEGTILHTRDGGANWQTQASGTASGLRSVHFVDAHTGWVVGTEGTVLHTRDGGANWQTQARRTNASQTSVHFVDAQTGWAVDNRGAIRHTRDGGANWRTQVSGTYPWLSSVHFIDAQNGWAVGDWGTILRTRDGGTNWQPQASGTTSDLSSVHFADTHTGWVMGDAGTILRTRDGGANWQTQVSGTSAPLMSVHFVDAQTGWAVGDKGTILHTRDGGVIWQTQASGTTSGLRSVHFADVHTGWGVGNGGTVRHTRDGGANWLTQASGTNVPLMSVHFADGQAGWAVGDEGTILHTRDSGANWLTQASGTSVPLMSVHFADAQTGWAVGDEGTILHTRDGGANWQTQASGTNTWLTSVHFADAQIGWAVGDEGAILHTRDGGANWQEQASGTNAWLTSVHFADAQSGWAAEVAGTILHTHDGGANWQKQASETIAWLSSLHFIDAQTGWAVGDEGTILHTRDGGANWQRQASGTNAWLTKVHFTDARTGWVVGDGGTVLHTRNGGVNWQTQSRRTNLSISAIHLADSKIGWAVGDQGMILHTRDGGTDWQKQASGTTSRLRSVHFADPQIGWVVGDAGTILHTRDGGANWQRRTSSTGAGLTSVHFADVQTGWVVGTVGTILHTRDGGANWQTQAIETNAPLRSVHFSDTQTGWVVGDDGTILHTRDGGVNWQRQSRWTNAWLSAVHFADAQTGWAVGGQGTILHTRDGGANWQTQAVETNAPLRSLHFFDAQTGWVVGDEGTILHTRDAGANWQTQAVGTNAPLMSVHFADAQTGWAVGEEGTMLQLSPWSNAMSTHGFRPANWYWLLLPGVLTLWLAGCFPRSHGNRLSALIGGRLLSDRPLYHPDQLDPRSPLLAQAQEMSAFLRNEDTLAPVSLAIEGDWGSGKSSLMQIVHGDLRRKGFAPVWFNAWHHERGEHLLASLYHAMRQHWYAPGPWMRFGAPGETLAWLHNTLRLLWRRTRQHPMLAALWVFGTSLVLSYAWGEVQNLVSFLVGTSDVRPPSSAALWLWPTLAFLALASPFLGIVLWQWWMRRKFRANLGHLLSADGAHSAESKAAARIRFAQALADWSHARGNWRLVLFIDDLDRCAPETVLEVLELSNFLATTGQVICVMALQQSWVLDCIRLHYRELFRDGKENVDADETANRYLEKMFTLRLHVRALADCDVCALLGRKPRVERSPPMGAPSVSASGQDATASVCTDGITAPKATAGKSARNWCAALQRFRSFNAGAALQSTGRWLQTATTWLLVLVRMLRPTPVLVASATILLLLAATWYGHHLAGRLSDSAEFSAGRIFQQRVDAWQASVRSAPVVKALTCLAERVAHNEDMRLPLCNPPIDVAVAASNPSDTRRSGSEHDEPHTVTEGRTYTLRLGHLEPSLQWGDVAVQSQAGIFSVLFLLLVVSMAWQAWRSLRGEAIDTVFENDSEEFLSEIYLYSLTLAERVRTPREWKRLLNQLRQATISIGPLLCQLDADQDSFAQSYQESVDALAALQDERNQLGPGLRRSLIKAREAHARSRLPTQRFSPTLERQAMLDIVAIVLQRYGVPTPEISAERRKLIEDNLPRVNRSGNSGGCVV